MALEAVVFSQDPPLTGYSSCRDQYHFSNSGVGLGPADHSFFSYDFLTYSTPYDNTDVENVESNKLFWVHQHQYVDSGYSSPEGHCNQTRNYTQGEGEPPQPLETASVAVVTAEGGGGRRKRRRRSCKNEKEVEHQRMTHIAVERNRRKQMNEYLAVIRSLMPSSYAQRGDQASVVGGAINYVKELEQLLHSLEAQKRTKHHGRRQDPPEKQPPPPSEHPSEGGNSGSNDEIEISISDFTGVSVVVGHPPSEYWNGTTQQGGNSVSRKRVNSDEVEVTMVESHANVKILAKKQPKQLLRLVAAFQSLRLSVLHLNVTSVDSSFLLYSFSLKVEEGCQLNSVDDITAAVNHILGPQIEEETPISFNN